MSDFSENEDDPLSSGDDWKEAERKRNKRRISSRLSKKPRLVLVDNLSTEEESEEELNLSRSRNGGPKKQIPIVENSKSDIMYLKEPLQLENRSEFSSGSFVIAKSDVQSYTPSNPPHIWRIDGKALLQKFEPYNENGMLKYRNTSIYTGWSSLEMDKYAALKDVNVLLNTNQKLLLTFNSNQLKDIIIDSD